MEADAFKQMLLGEGFAEAVLVTRDAGSMDEHTHPFEAKALIVSGEILIGTTKQQQSYKAGDIFHLLADTPHTETYGPDGVVYLVGRR